MTRAGSRLAAAFGSLVLLAGGALALASAPAVSSQMQATGTAGYCPTDSGVTVVVDFQELGGGIVVRCAPGPVGHGFSGIDALRGAGFTVEGVRRYGLAFVCRIAGKPGPDQALPLQGDPNYREACVNTPPAGAFWGSWYAANKGSWTYSQASALNRDAIPGGFEGWSFSLNHTEGSAPPPGIAPTRPDAPPTTPPSHSPTAPPTHPTSRPPSTPPGGTPSRTPTAPPHTTPPRSTSPDSPTSSTTATTATTATTKAGAGRQVDRGGPASPHHRHHGGAYGSTLSTGPPSATVSPTDPVAVGHNDAGESVSGDLPASGADPGGGPSGGAVVALLACAMLLAGAGAATWRRRVRSE